MSGLPASSSSSSSRAVVPPSVLVSITATPWLATIVGIQAVSGFLEQLGIASEEMFRGDRLPILHFSDAHTERLRQQSGDLEPIDLNPQIE
jgi:hypothetical protein